MLRPFCLALALGAALGGCDFTPTLDIDTPAFEDGLVLNTVLFADSTARVRVTRARDPYGVQTTSTGAFPFEIETGATVTLRRDGGPPETLPFVSRQCETGYDFSTDAPTTTECGFYASALPIAGGAAYTLRAEVPGQAAEASVRVPARVAATATRVPGTPADGQPTDRITLRFRDPAGLGNAYGLDALQTADYTQTQYCDIRGCRDSTFTVRYVGQTSFTTADPILLAGLRGIPGGSSFVTFSDALFDGQERAFTVEARVYDPDLGTSQRSIRLIAFDRLLVEAYEQAYFSLGADNPFQEPFDPMSNVRGGYGLVGAAAITEIALGTH
ncbi:MAG TPA: DUF4249 domain-containing protein [Rubricoccaceae bacterium]|jgi:hypothetical protein